jgi:hypothetical protein
VTNVPGTVYVGCLTGPEHKVCHLPCRDDELLDVPGLGACSLTVMCRTALFAGCRSRVRNTTPSPPQLLRAITDVCSRTFATEEFRFPTLQECEACLLADEGEVGLPEQAKDGAVQESPRKRLRMKAPVVKGGSGPSGAA